MKKIAAALLLIFSTLLLGGCYNYNDINKVLFVTAVLIDADDQQNPILYLETFKPYRSTTKGSEKGQKIIFKGTAKTVLQAERDINISSSFKLNFSQNKAILFTKKAAEFGLSNYIDFFERDHELLIKPHIAIYLGDPEALMKTKIKEEDYLGIYIVDLFQNQGAASRTVNLTLNQYLIERNMGSKTSVVTAINLKKNVPEPEIEINGGAVIKNDKIVGIISKEDGEKYNFLVNKVKFGTLEESNPCNKNKFVTLDILDSKTKTNLSYKNGKITLIKNITVVCNLCEADKGINFNKKSIDTIINEAEFSIKEECTGFFNKYKNMNIDIFNIEKEFSNKYPQNKISDIMKKTEIKVNAKVNMKSSSDNFNF